jgi:hypothetical protein
MTITLTREEAQQVLDALADAAWCVQHNNLPPDEGHDWDKELELLRTRLAQPEPETCGYDETTGNCTQNPCCYPSPPQREWQGLTDEEIMSLLPGAVRLPPGWSETVRAIEAKLKEKNS